MINFTFESNQFRKVLYAYQVLLTPTEANFGWVNKEMTNTIMIQLYIELGEINLGVEFM